MTSKTIVITGASDGIGAAAAKQLKEAGHRVVIVGRSAEKTRRVAKALEAPYHLADYARLSDVVRLAGELSRYERIDVLANNAGGAQGDRTLTEDGFERTFQINVLAGFLLTRLLAEKLCASHATVIQTASIAANLFGADLTAGDWQNERDYTPFKAYGYAKLEDILFTRELQRRYGARGLCAVAFEPGVVRTNFASESVGFIRFCYHSPLKYLFTISPARSARRLTWLATGTPESDFASGETYSKHDKMKLKFTDGEGAVAAALWQACFISEAEALRHLGIIDKGDGLLAVNGALPDLRPAVGMPDAWRSVLQTCLGGQFKQLQTVGGYRAQVVARDGDACYDAREHGDACLAQRMASTVLTRHQHIGVGAEPAVGHPPVGDGGVPGVLDAA